MVSHKDSMVPPVGLQWFLWLYLRIQWFRQWVSLGEPLNPWVERKELLENHWGEPLNPWVIRKEEPLNPWVKLKEPLGEHLGEPLNPWVKLKNPLGEPLGGTIKSLG